jgi:hypothetical protein
VRRRVKYLAAIVVFVSLGTLSGCTDPADKAAKKRIFSPEDPPQAVAAASEKLPPQDAADNPVIARRILGMGAAEATERLGAHHAVATIDWEWTQAGKSIRLKETRDLLDGPGGMSGDFSARLSNTNNAGLEVMRVGGRVFARNTWGRDGESRFRERTRDRGIAERLREEAYGGLGDVDELFRGRLKLTAQSSAENTATFADRTAWKYTVSLGDALADTGSKLPAVIAPKNGQDDTTRRRQHFFEARTPVSLQGDLLVDSKTSVVLKAHVVGHLVVKGEDGGVGDTELRITIDTALSDVGKAVAIDLPKDFMPDEDKPDGVAAALTRFGLSRKNVDGGVPAAAEVPDEEAVADDEEKPAGTPTPAVSPTPTGKPPKTRPKKK